jgi:peptidoglycan/xylan/chitin deacetylase (PgdA/CDA1 family)
MTSAAGINLSKLISKSCLIFTILFSSIAFSSNTKTKIAPVKSEPVVSTFAALCYHDISTGFVGNMFSLRQKDLITQFDYLKAHYNVVGLQDIVAASEGKKVLPPKAVLLTFDDGLASFYENVYPLLKKYNFKAVFAVVTKWTEDGSAPDYGFKDSNPKMANWKQLKEMSKSGLVEVVSHSYDLHQGQVMNPQGNQAAVAGYFKYDQATKAYQSDEEFMSRIEADLKKSNELLKKHLDKDNTVMVWPYGNANGLAVQAAKNAGMKIQMTLQPGLNTTANISHIGRGLMLSAIDMNQFATLLESAFVDSSQMRMIRVDIDSLWKKTDKETEQTLGDLLEQVYDLGPNNVLVQAVSDSGEAYFTTSKMKVRGDYLSRTAHTMKYRARVANTYARLPIGFGKDLETAKAVITDLAKYTDLDGVFFELAAKDKVSSIDFASLLAAAKLIRPHWQFGLIGQVPPTTPDLFSFVVLNPQQLEADKASLIPVDKAPFRVIASLPVDYKLSASHLMAQGYSNLFYDVNAKSFVPDADFKALFSTSPINPHHAKGEAK